MKSAGQQIIQKLFIMEKSDQETLLQLIEFVCVKIAMLGT